MAHLAFDLSGLRVIVIEDDPFARDQVVTALKHIGVKFLNVVEEAAQALALLDAGRHCDVIVSDWRMPDMDGLQLLPMVRTRWPQTTFLMVSVNESHVEIKQAIDAGVDGYLTKPFTLDRLRDAMQSALARRLRGTTFVDRVNSEELAAVLASVNDALDFAQTSTGPGITPTQLTRRLASSLIEAVGMADSANQDQLAVIRAYGASIEATTSLDAASTISHEARNRIVDGLALATHIAWGRD